MQSGPRGLEYKRDSESSRTIARRRAERPQEELPERSLASRLVSGDAADRVAALKRLEGRKEALLELACSSAHPDVRAGAVALLSDPRALSEVARFSHFQDSREGAVRRLSGRPAQLADVACSSHFSDARALAIGMMDDEARVEVAVRSQRADARKAAVKSVAGIPALMRVIEETPFRSARRQAVARMAGDLDALSAVAVSSRHRDARKAAIAQLRDRINDVGADVLVEIAALSADEDARYVALSLVSDSPVAMRRVCLKAAHKDIRTAALVLMSEHVGSIDDSGLLGEIALRSPDREARLAATSKLAADPESLLGIALCSRFQDARDSALRALSGDPAMLRKVSRASSYRDTRRKAHALISNGGALRELLERML